MEKYNPLRQLVKYGPLPIKEIARQTNLHPNTITNLIKPGGPVRLDTAQKVARLYGYRLVIVAEPIDET